MMRVNIRRCLLAGLAVAGLATAVPGAAVAHHGWSSYDAEKVVVITAKLEDVVWRNPHAEAKVEYQGKKWTVILAPISRMEARGLSSKMLTNGVTAKLEGYPRSDGTPEMRLERITVEGKTVELR